VIATAVAPCNFSSFYVPVTESPEGFPCNGIMTGSSKYVTTHLLYLRWDPVRCPAQLVIKPVRGSSTQVGPACACILQLPIHHRRLILASCAQICMLTEVLKAVATCSIVWCYIHAGLVSSRGTKCLYTEAVQQLRNILHET